MKTLARCLRTLTFSATSLAGLAAQAAVDNLDGYTGSLFGQSGGATSGGIAWTGNWADAGAGQSAGIVNAAMGTVNGFSSAAPFAEYALTGGNILNSTRAFTFQGNQATVWVYGLVAAGKAGGFSPTNSFGGIGLYEGTTEKFLLGQRFGEANWGLATASGLTGSATSSTAIGNFATTLLLAKIDQTANTLAFYVNPNFGLTEAGNTPAFTASYGGADDDIDTIRLRGGNAGTSVTWQFDNVNVTQATPFVPEPSTALLLVGGLGLAGLRRMRHPR